MRCRFVTCDVFTDRRFSGNQLAVVPEAEGLSATQMQAIAAEFNYSETTFVLPPDDPAHLARLRIFTPATELPFAGHPTIGTALALVRLGRAPERGEILLEEGAGSVRVRLTPGSAELTTPSPPEHGPALPAPALQALLGLGEGEVLSRDGLPCVASAGLPFLLVELASREALAKAQLVGDLPDAGGKGIFLFTRQGTDAGFDLHARMFVPGLGVAEDPATGSAAAALAGFLAGRPGLAEGWHGWSIAQGIEMGRPSRIEARALRQDGRVAEIRVGGQAVPVAEGMIEVSA
jgi:trans-2,3-dihydro-3-hydroxyanthranilate isomerase